MSCWKSCPDDEHDNHHSTWNRAVYAAVTGIVIALTFLLAVEATVPCADCLLAVALGVVGACMTGIAEPHSTSFVGACTSTLKVTGSICNHKTALDLAAVSWLLNNLGCHHLLQHRSHHYRRAIWFLRGLWVLNLLHHWLPYWLDLTWWCCKGFWAFRAEACFGIVYKGFAMRTHWPVE